MPYLQPERFFLLRGTSGGPLYLAWIEAPDHADTWTADRADVRRFVDRDEADRVRATIVAREGIAVAVVPDLG